MATPSISTRPRPPTADAVAEARSALEVEPLSETLRVRDARPDDRPVLEAMLFEAFFWRPEAERPALARFREVVEFQKWVRDFFARPGDLAVVAETGPPNAPTPVGAAFARLFDDECHSYGYIDAETPELALGVAAEARGRGVGQALVEALCARARRAGLAAICLSVETDNAARRLYARAGFERVGTNGGAWTMRCDLLRAGSARAESRP